MKNKIICIFLILVLFTPTILNAANKDEIGFTFHVNGYNNSRVKEGRFRDDHDNSTMWSVEVYSSTECNTCKTKFWLEDYSGDNISSTTSVAPGQRHSQKPYNKASRKDNFLTAEDNDVTPSNFTVKGNWDEEWK